MLPWPTSDSQPRKSKRKSCRSLLAGLQHPVSLLPVRRKPLGLAEHGTAFALGHRHRACACRAKQALQDCKLQVRALSTCKVTLPNWKVKGGRGDDHRQFSPLRRMAEDRFPLSKPDATAHFSARRSLLPTGILQCLKSGLSILQNWNLKLEGFALKKGK